MEEVYCGCGKPMIKQGTFHEYEVFVCAENKCKVVRRVKIKKVQE